jgi:hypothetical protein
MYCADIGEFNVINTQDLKLYYSGKKHIWYVIHVHAVPLKPLKRDMNTPLISDATCSAIE